jgi:hypothetical protein
MCPCKKALEPPLGARRLLTVLKIRENETPFVDMESNPNCPDINTSITVFI